MDPEAVDGIPRVPHGSTDDARVLDFSANTNPDRPSGVASVYDSALASSRRYPPDDYCTYRVVAGEYVGCDPKRVVPTAGGLNAFRLAFEVSLDPGDSALVPAPSFGEYAREIRLQGAEPEFVPYDEILTADPAGHAVAVVCNPNNPTGNAYDAADLRAFAERCRQEETVLVADEAFLDFTDRPSLAGEPGVVVARSLTKMFGLPGLRAGFAVATGETGRRLTAARPAWGLSTPAAQVGVHCMRRTGFVAETRARVRDERERMRDALEPAYGVHPSDAPFLLLDVGTRDVDAVLDAARERGIALRDATTFRGLNSHVRVAVKRPDQNDRLLDCLRGL